MILPLKLNIMHFISFLIEPSAVKASSTEALVKDLGEKQVTATPELLLC